MRGLFFEPWKGKNYGDDSAFGIPVMVLGESHYDPENRKNRRITIELIEDELDGGSGYRFFTNIAASFLGAIPDADQRAKFWKAVVYYTYIQGFVGAKPRMRPTDAMWANSAESFSKVLEKYRPRLVAVFGYGLWEELPNRGENTDPIISDGRSVACYNFSLQAGGTALAPKLRHPSSGFNFQTWHPVVQEAVRRARLIFH